MKKKLILASLAVAACLCTSIMFAACDGLGGSTDSTSSSTSISSSSSGSTSSSNSSSSSSSTDSTSSESVDLTTYTGVYNGVCYDNGSLVTGVYSGKYYVDGVPYTGYETIDGTKYRIVDGIMTRFTATAWDGTTVGTGFANVASGNSSNPFQISSAAQLMFFADKMENAYSNFYNCYFELTADIDLGGNDITAFASTGAQFNGNGHVITNFNLVTDSNSHCGLFRTSNGKIVNLSVDNFTITNKNCEYVGALVGYLNSSGRIIDCYVNGTINTQVSSSDKMYVGLLAGYVNTETSEAAISGCHVAGSITYDISAGKTSAPVYAGGLAGYVAYAAGAIEDSYSTATVSLTVSSNNAYAGGIAGYTKGTITNCYSTGAVTSSGDTAYAGGIVGAADGTVTGCVALGNVTSGNYAGGIIGSSSKGTSCYGYGQTVSGKSNSTTYTATAATEDQMNSATFWKDTLTWDNTVWDFSTLNVSYGLLPTLK
ncbi:MAG: hypothetical protein LUI60_06310 [Clostridia bacterium]|nr:hypothetical protein [Clostridia bacterium]